MIFEDERRRSDVTSPMDSAQQPGRGSLCSYLLFLQADS